MKGMIQTFGLLAAGATKLRRALEARLAVGPSTAEIERGWAWAQRVRAEVADYDVFRDRVVNAMQGENKKPKERICSGMRRPAVRMPARKLINPRVSRL